MKINPSDFEPLLTAFAESINTYNIILITGIAIGLVANIIFIIWAVKKIIILSQNALRGNISLKEEKVNEIGQINHFKPGTILSVEEIEEIVDYGDPFENYDFSEIYERYPITHKDKITVDGVVITKDNDDPFVKYGFSAKEESEPVIDERDIIVIGPETQELNENFFEDSLERLELEEAYYDYIIEHDLV